MCGSPYERQLETDAYLSVTGSVRTIWLPVELLYAVTPELPEMVATALELPLSEYTPL